MLKKLSYNPSDLKFQQLPVREKLKKTEINRMRNVYLIDTLIRVDIQQNVKVAGEMLKVDETSPFRKFIDFLFD